MENTGIIAKLPSLTEQAERLIRLGVPEIIGVSASSIREAAATLSQALTTTDHNTCIDADRRSESNPAKDNPAASNLVGTDSDTCTDSTSSPISHSASSSGSNALLVPSSITCSFTELMELVEHQGKKGFVVEDFTDSADFIAVSGPESQPANLPDGEWYTLMDPCRGDEFSNASPAEALAIISGNERISLTITEGIFWLLQQPEVLERNHCFMTIGSRKPKAKSGFDSRTPALWISNGTGRDGSERRNAPKLGWCWWNNRHTWLGIAHAEGRMTGLALSER
ncbi:MAG: DUF5701 family protein [Ancrocorticia sp.]